jgi:hypothetical protein
MPRAGCLKPESDRRLSDLVSVGGKADAADGRSATGDQQEFFNHPAKPWIHRLNHPTRSGNDRGRKPHKSKVDEPSVEHPSRRWLVAAEAWSPRVRLRWRSREEALCESMTTSNADGGNGQHGRARSAA